MISRISTIDRDKIWHPYTQMKANSLPIVIKKAKGALLYDEQGKSYIDAISSWWVNLHGHSHPAIGKAINNQFKNIDQIIFAQFTHEPAAVFSEMLLADLKKQKKIFYSDNGSTAVEVALKMAVQYWHNQGINKNKIIAFKGAYHGDTFGAMSVSDRGVFTLPFQKMLFEVIFIDPPVRGGDHVEYLRRVNSHFASKEIAAFIYEPLVMGAGGMIMHSVESLEALLNLCKENYIVTIADEVMTGFGRTGKFFASDHLKWAPDIMAFSKGITGGVLPLGATSCNEKIFEPFLSEEKTKTFFHGHSYTANPLALAAAISSYKLLKKSTDKIQSIVQAHSNFSDVLSVYKEKIINIRQTGTIMAFDVKVESNSGYFSNIRDLLYDSFLKKGVLLRPLGNTIYILPPYCISQKELNRIYSAIIATINEIL